MEKPNYRLQGSGNTFNSQIVASTNLKARIGDLGERTFFCLFNRRPENEDDSAEKCHCDDHSSGGNPHEGYCGYNPCSSHCNGEPTCSCDSN